MQCFRPARQLGCLGLLAVLGLTVLTARAEDMARRMPCDTALYIGWSQLVEMDSPELRLEQKLADAVAELLAKQSPGRAPRWLKPLLDLLLTLQTRSVGIGLFDVTLLEGQPDVQAALVADAGDDAARLCETLHRLVAAALGPDLIQQHTVQEVSLECAHLGQSPMYLLWGLHQGYFLAALGDVAAGQVIECINGTAGSLADAPELQFDRHKVQAQADGRHACLYVDVRRIVTRGKELATQQMGELPPVVEPALQELGLNSVRSKYLHFDWTDGPPRVMAFAHLDGPMCGLLKLCDQKPLTDEDLRIVPKNAYWAEVGNLNLAELWQEARRVLESLAPQLLAPIDGVLAAGSQFVGFSLVDDLLPVFGDTWALFDAPDHGGILLSGTVLVAEVRDAEALQGMLTHLVQFLTPLAGAADVRLMLKQVRHGEDEIHYVLIGGAPCPVAPAWTLVGDRWVFGLFPQTVATAARQVDPKTRGESLLDNPEFQAARAAHGRPPQAVDYVDSRYFTRMFYPFVNALRTLGVSMLARYGLELDLQTMPPLPESAENVTNYVGLLSRDEDGVLYAGRGHCNPLGLAAGTTALAGSVMLPSLAAAREQARAAKSMANLKQIGTACHLYALGHDGQFPTSLEQLVEGGLIAREVLSSPLDPEGGASYAYVAGQTSEGDSENVLAYELTTHGDRRSVLFADGHVERIGSKELARSVRETYRRLGRQDDIPAEFRPGPGLDD
jgi:prepilin-type processing-associated H-X9-DG protein